MNILNTLLRDEIRQFYDKAYKDLNETEIQKWGPDPEVISATRLVRPKGKALDIGCGRGLNTIFLAEQGFEVKAIDISATAIKIVNDEAQKKGLTIQADVADIKHELLPDNYDVIVNAYMLDHLDEEHANWIIRRMIEKTAPGGVNVVITVSGNIVYDLREDEILLESRKHYFEHELRDLYKNWDILSCYEVLDERMVKGVPVVRLIAQKPE